MNWNSTESRAADRQRGKDSLYLPNYAEREYWNSKSCTLKFSHRSIWMVIFAGILIAIVIPFIKYFTFFTGNTSNNPNDWANFATFWAAFISLANTGAIIYLTYYFQKHELNRNSILERPILSLSQKEDKTSYKISNVGKGTALNVRAYCSSSADYNSQIFTQRRICYSLITNDSFDRYWLNCTLIILEYTDVFNNSFYSMMENDMLYIFDAHYEPLLKTDYDEIKKVTEKFQDYMTWDRSNPTWP